MKRASSVLLWSLTTGLCPPLRQVRGPSLRLYATKEEVWTVPKVRETFIKYFEEKHEHSIVKSSPVVPLADPSLLFTNAGMNQFKSIFLGSVEPSSPLAKLERACNAQKCIRAGGKHNDLEDVGLDTYHHTFFEMLGSWSFGDYFKAEAIEWAWELLIGIYKLDPERMYATYFGGDEAEGLPADEEAKKFWLRYLPESRVLPGSKKDNFWEMGESGPCGACSELHYDVRGGRGEVPHLVNADDPEVLELWNLVFIEFDRSATTGKLSSLPAKHIDTGLGLERLVAVLQGKLSNYDTDAFMPIFEAIRSKLPEDSAAYQRGYQGCVGTDDIDSIDTAFRAISDHLRCLCIAIADGARPSNEGRGYVLRRVLRRAVRYARQTLGARETSETPFMASLVPTLAHGPLGDAYPELRTQMDDIMNILADEERAFLTTLDRGLKYLDESIADLKDNILPGKKAFFLYDSLGFPIDLTRQVAGERGVAVDEDGFREAMAEQVARSRASGSKSGLTNRFILSAAQTAALSDAGVTTTESLAATTGATSVQDARILAAFAVKGDDDELAQVPVEEALAGTHGSELGLILDYTPFYAEGGGQVADTGNIGSSFQVLDVQSYAGYLLHVGHLEKALESITVECTVNLERRANIVPNHSMTHTLNHALRIVLGDNVEQRGSLCDDQRLRFDFSHPRALNSEELGRIETLVQDAVQADLKVDAQLVPLDKARGIGALRAVFGEAYPDPVRVVAQGCVIDEVLESPESERWNDFSIELCGGTHLQSTQEAQAFVITEETAVAKGIRRIEAVTRQVASEAQAAGSVLTEKVAALEQQVQTDDDSKMMSEALKALRSDLDSAVAPASIKPELRLRLDAAGKLLVSRQKELRSFIMNEAASLATETAKLASEEERSAFVLHLPPGLDAKAAASLANQVTKSYPDLAFFAATAPDPIANDDKIKCFAAVPDNHPIFPNANTWLQAALKPLNGRGGGKPNFAQGSVPANDDDQTIRTLLKSAQDILESSSH